MQKQDIYNVIKDIASGLSVDGVPLSLPPSLDESALVVASGLEEVSLSELLDDLESRFGGRSLGGHQFLNPHEMMRLTWGALLDRVKESLSTRIEDPVVVYVDDEEENIFIFKRKFGKQLKLKTFTDPREALEYIKGESKVALVITDEVMPGLKGNALCDEVRKVKPFMRFILITGNPDGDENLMYKSLRGNRFFEFINKPLDLDGKASDYLKVIRDAME